MKVALVHDYLNQYGGAERVLEVLCELFPDAPIYTLLYDDGRTHGRFRHRKIITSFIQHLPGALRRHRWYFPLMPRAVERWDFSEFDLVISQSAAFAKGVVTPPRVKHLCYLLTPTRFLWDEARSRMEEELPLLLRPLAYLLIRRLQKWDLHAAKRPNLIIPISQHIKQQAERVYHRAIGDVIYPPVDVRRLEIVQPRPPEPRPYFLIVSRLIPYKRIDIAINACEMLGVELRIIGTGRDRRRLLALAGRHTKLLGELPQELTDAYYQHAEAFLQPQCEDFGIAAVEAMAAGAPVIAYRAGGAEETVMEVKTGRFFDQQTAESLAAALRNFSKSAFDGATLRQQARKFDMSIFCERFLSLVNSFVL